MADLFYDIGEFIKSVFVVVLIVSLVGGFISFIVWTPTESIRYYKESNTMCLYEKPAGFVPTKGTCFTLTEVK